MAKPINSILLVYDFFLTHLGALSSAGGVMLFISFADILPESVEQFNCYNSKHATKFA